MSKWISIQLESTALYTHQPIASVHTICKFISYIWIELWIIKFLRLSKPTSCKTEPYWYIYCLFCFVCSRLEVNEPVSAGRSVYCWGLPQSQIMDTPLYGTRIKRQHGVWRLTSAQFCVSKHSCQHNAHPKTYHLTPVGLCLVFYLSD